VHNTLAKLPKHLRIVFKARWWPTCCFPPEHRKRTRSTNLLERIFNAPPGRDLGADPDLGGTRTLQPRLMMTPRKVAEIRRRATPTESPRAGVRAEDVVAA
jgi:hypothetical protein